MRKEINAKMAATSAVSYAIDKGIVFTESSISGCSVPVLVVLKAILLDLLPFSLKYRNLIFIKRWMACKFLASTVIDIVNVLYILVN